MARLSQLLDPGWYQIPYADLPPDIRALVDNGAFQWGSTTSGGDDPKTMQGWQVRDYSKIPTLPDGTYFDNSNRDFNVHAGSWSNADSWDEIVDPSKVIDDPTWGRITTTDNAYDVDPVGDFMEKAIIATILAGGGLAAAGAAGMAVPSWVSGVGAAEGAGAAGWATGAGLDGIAGDVASSWLAPGGALTGGAAGTGVGVGVSENIAQGAGAGTAAGAGAATTGGEALTGLQAGAGAAAAGSGGWIQSVAAATGLSPDVIRGLAGVAGIAAGINSDNQIGRATEQTRAGISDAIGELQTQRQNIGAGYKPFIEGGLAGLNQLGQMGNGQKSLAGRYKSLGSGRWRA